MTKFCLSHNSVYFNGRWIFPREDVTKIINKPATLDKCPKCLEEEERIKAFFRRNNGYNTS